MNDTGEGFKKTILEPMRPGELKAPCLQLFFGPLVEQELDERVPFVKRGQRYFPNSLLMPTPFRIAPESVVARPG